MDPLDWYEGIDAVHQRHAYTLAWRLCRSEETAARRIIPTAVEIAYKSVRRRDRRIRESPTGWKIMLSDPQLLQIGILEAAERQGWAPGTDPWLPYIAHLTLCTLPRNSFYVAVGFGRFLTTGSSQDVLSLYEFLEPSAHSSREMTDVSSAFRAISRQMSERFREHMPAAQPQLAFTQIPKKAGDGLYHVLAAMLPWESRHLPDTDAAFSAVQEARRRTIAEGLDTTPGRPHGRRRRRAAAMVVAAEVEIERAHVCMDQQRCLEQVKRWGVGFDTAFARWRIPSLDGMQTNFNVDPWDPPGGSDWGRINEDIMREINWRQWQERRRGQGPNATFEVRVDGQVQAVITPSRRNSVTISLPASARYVEIQDPERQVVVATCHLMDPHDLPRGGWRRAVPLPAGGSLRFTLSALPHPETQETDICMAVAVSPSRVWGPATRRVAERVRARMAKRLSTVPPRWALAGAVMGLVLSLTLSGVLAARLFTPQVTMAVSYSGAELIGITEVGHGLEDHLGAKLVLDHTEPTSLVRYLEEMVAAGTMQWDLISVDNDTLGILIQKGLVQDLSRYRPQDKLIPDTLLDPLRAELPADGPFYFVPFRPNVKLTYYNRERLSQVGHGQPPATWEALWQLAQDLASDDPASGGRVAIQAHPGKAAAVTVFEFVTGMKGDPLTLDDDGARQAFTRLWNLAPSLEPASTTIQFNTANDMLITNRVSLVSNWTYGIKVVRENARKTDIHVAPNWPGSARVLGGDVLAIPRGAPHPERAIKLIELLVAKQTQLTLANRLFWAPVRQDVYAELSSQGGRQEHFQVIREALRTAVVRPTTPEWGMVEEVLSDALQEVLRQGRAKGAPATAADIEALLRPYAARLREIPREYITCTVVRKKTLPEAGCEVEVQTVKNFRELADDFNTTPDILAKVNGRGNWDPVSPENMRILLVPKPMPGI